VPPVTSVLVQQLSVPLPPEPQFVIPGPPGAQLGGVGPASPPPLELELPEPPPLEELLPEPGPPPDDGDAASLAPASPLPVPVFELELPHPETPNAAASAIAAHDTRCDPGDERISFAPQNENTAKRRACQPPRVPLVEHDTADMPGAYGRPRCRTFTKDGETKKLEIAASVAARAAAAPWNAAPRARRTGHR